MRMRSAELVRRPVWSAERDGDVKLPTRHGEHVWGVVYDLIECHQRKAECHELNDRPQTDHCRADSQPGKSVLAYGGVDDPPRPKALKQTMADFVGALVFSHFLAHKKDVWIAFNFFRERFIQCLTIRDLSHHRFLFWRWPLLELRPRWFPRPVAARFHGPIGIRIIVKRIERRLRTVLSKLYGRQHGFFCSSVEQIELFVRQFSLSGKLRAQTRDRVVEPIFLQFLFRPVTCRVRHRVAAVTIRPHFPKRRMRFLPNGIDNLCNLVAYFAKVHSIDDFPGDVVAFGAIDDLPERGRSFYGRTHREEVIFTNENNRQFIKSREIQRFVEGALVNRSVAEEAKRDTIFATILDGESQSHR